MIDVFFKPEYGKLYESIEHGICEVFEFTCEFGSVRNVFIKRPVPWLVDNVQYYDITTPYGYGGPLVLSFNDKEQLLKSYKSEWIKYCQDNLIVCEFVRFHLFDNVDVCNLYYGEIIYISDNIAVDTTVDTDTIWMSFKQQVRNNIRRAIKSNLTVEKDIKGKRLDDFMKIYYDTMKRNNASSYYYFDESFFHTICNTLCGNYVFFHTLLKNKVISTELVLYSEKYCYSFLAGTESEYFNMNPNYLIKYEIIKWSHETGLKAFILGGGYSKEDGIYHYKKSFSEKGIVSYHIGKMIHNNEIYNFLVDKRKENENFDKNNNFFPQYRSK